MRAVLAAAAAVLAVCGCGSFPAGAPAAPAATAAPALRQVSDPGHVTGTLTGPCHARDGGQLPDPACDSGAYDPRVTAAVLCAAGYTTRSYRPPSSETDRFKFQVAYPAYGLSNIPGMPSELDHLIPLELGGSNDAANLWPEAGAIPNPKDRIETALHAAVCSGRVSLAAAQAAISADWLTAEHALGLS